MKLSCIIGFHRWEYHRNINTGNSYRICRKCGRVQPLVIHNDHFVWRNINKEEEEELKKRIDLIG